jgi:hypothetical protein
VGIAIPYRWISVLDRISTLWWLSSFHTPWSHLRKLGASAPVLDRLENISTKDEPYSIHYMGHEDLVIRGKFGRNDGAHIDGGYLFYLVSTGQGSKTPTQIECRQLAMVGIVQSAVLIDCKTPVFSMIFL